MKLLKTIKKIIEESEQIYNSACEGAVSVDELDRLEKNYKDSLKLLKLYKIKEEKSTKKRQ
jgi:lipoate synthase